ncbi:MAG: 4-alpha-glucanotransferase [Spirochaetaceae bacterium]|jgi:4-alpha-glucanotransferase|nr:4-alpha-glucanotransferase [Spirochaetaceae bacterium]
MKGTREAGILLAVSSLPSPYGIGNFGKDAYKWIDFLAQSGQTYWQILPLGPTGWGDSPYQTFSCFAISPYSIDIDALVKDNLLTQDEAKDESAAFVHCKSKCDYGLLYQRRNKLLRSAYLRFVTNTTQTVLYQQFCTEHAFWLTDYTAFMSQKAKSGHDEFFQFEQFIAFTQWQKLKSYAGSKGIKIIGDMPIYPSPDSADVFFHPDLFQLDASKKPTAVAGCPPDAFTSEGQVWGNPLYRWDVLKEQHFDWWLKRLDTSLQLFDVLRIDHFRGFESYFSIPAGDASAVNGHWEEGPGMAFINAVHTQFGKEAPIIAEDLGYLTPQVHALLDASGFPGMKLLQFAFDSRESSNSAYFPYNYPKNTIAYTGTHDNIPSAAWAKNASPADVELAVHYFGISGTDDLCSVFVNALMGSVSDTAIIPLQDWLGLGAEARMNTPSIASGNWQWRLSPDMLDKALSDRIRTVTKITGRKQC